METDSRRNRIFAYIVQQAILTAGRVPTRRQIAAELDLSVSIVDFHLHKLAEEKLIIFDATPGRSRNYAVVGGKWVYEPAQP